MSGSDLITWLSSQASNSSNLQDFADYVYTHYINVSPAPSASGSAVASDEKATINLNTAGPGYYLVYGTGDNGTTKVVASVSLTTTDPTADVEPKLSVPTLTKEIQHNELATPPSNGWGNVGDNQIGDTVNYRTFTSVPDTNNYTSYTYEIHDTMSDGLTFNSDSLVVYTDANKSNTLAASNYTVSSNAHSFTITFTNIISTISTNSLTSADKFYVYYDATLNENAKVYTEGHNDNTAYLVYSNNPYDGGTGESPHVTVYDWTFTMGVNKTDKDSKPLLGAEFILNTDEDSTGSPIALINNGNSTYTVVPSGTDGAVTTISAGNITIKGLDDSITYYLHETKAPVGYNLLTAPVSFVITAGYETAGNTLLSGSTTVTVGSNPASATLSTNVMNYTGNQLPSTGGMGTTAFYAVGGTLAAGAGIMLIARKRVKNEK